MMPLDVDPDRLVIVIQCVLSAPNLWSVNKRACRLTSEHASHPRIDFGPDTMLVAEPLVKARSEGIDRIADARRVRGAEVATKFTTVNAHDPHGRHAASRKKVGHLIRSPRTDLLRLPVSMALQIDA